MLKVKFIQGKRISDVTALACKLPASVDLMSFKLQETRSLIKVQLNFHFFPERFSRRICFEANAKPLFS